MSLNKKHAAVIGHPINHSLSPKIHNYWIKKQGINAIYDKYDVLPQDLEKFILSLKEKKICGINVTVPHKETAYNIVKKHGSISEIAKQSRAINTIYYNDNQQLIGTNTDYYGFKMSLLKKLKDFNLTKKKFLIIGAGGAAKAIISGLLLEKETNITVVNRSLDRAKKLQEFFSQKIAIADFKETSDLANDVDVIVNSTSCGLNNNNNLQINYKKITSRKIFYDIVYKPLQTKLICEAKNNGHETIEGLGMLIYQAAGAFAFFFQDKLKESFIEEAFTFI